MKRRLFSLLVLILLLGSILQSAAAASLRFQVLQSVVSVYINQDGTASLEYFYYFQNDPSGALIDYIDVGVPEKGDYDLGSVTADVDGKPITDIAKSDYVTPGIAFGLGGNSIQPGASGKVHIRIPTVRSFYYEATSKESEPYASFQFSPSSFSPDYCFGQTDMTVNIFLPADIQPTEPRYFPPQSWPGDSAPQTGVDNNGLSYYSWHSTSANSYSTYIFGGAFPGRLIPAAAIQKPPLINISSDTLIFLCICGGFLAIFGFSIYSATIGASRRKLQYLPPKIAIEGMGIKRGLTAVEAAILMEQPLDKIMTMILFSTIKKGAASVISKDPLKIQVTDPLPAELNQYETEFLAAFKLTNQADQRKALQTAIVNLVKSITEKMKGFSRKETIAYYESIMKKAWEQVEAAQTPDVKMQTFDDQLDWTMLDKDFGNHTHNVFQGGLVYVPVWWSHYDPVYSGPSLPSHSGGGMISIPAPNLPGANFASSIVNGVSSFASNAVGDLTGFTRGITNQTNPVPVATSSGNITRGGGSSGGHSCVCACACACAGCACACAGGGR